MLVAVLIGVVNRLTQMLASGRRLLLVRTSFVILSLLVPSDGASNSMETLNQSHNKTGNPLEVIRKLFLLNPF